MHLIESHSQELASELLNRVHESAHLTSFSKVPDHELRQRVQEIYGHLGQELVFRTEGEIAGHMPRSARGAIAKASFSSELLWATILMKDNLWDFLGRELSSFLGQQGLDASLPRPAQRWAFFSLRFLSR